MSNPVDSKSPGGDPELEGHKAEIEHGYNLDDKAHAARNKADAIEAENMEHNMGVLEAVRAYPMATLWAFIMSCTIVSCLLPLPFWLSPIRNCS